jgi:hypothetical protein
MRLEQKARHSFRTHDRELGFSEGVRISEVAQVGQCSIDKSCEQHYCSCSIGNALGSGSEARKMVAGLHQASVPVWIEKQWIGNQKEDRISSS